MSDTVTHMRWRPSISFGTRLRALRKDYGKRNERTYTQEQFAQVLGIKATTYSSWESGRSVPSHVDAIAAEIEARTGCEREYLLDLTGATPGPEGPDDEYAPRDSNPEPADSVIVPLRRRYAVEVPAAA